MKQVIQSRRTGKLALKDVPAPTGPGRGQLLVRTRASLISAGTERMAVDFAKKSLAGKARARPDLVKKVLEKAKRDGIAATFQAVMARLDEPLPLGYSAVGDVVELGEGLEGRFRVGERVAIAGAGVANHAEFNLVPANLAAPAMDGVADDEACYGTLGAIAMHAVRNAGPELGDVVAVIGVGLVGQLAAQFVTLSGGRAVAVDFDPSRLDLARRLGAEAALNPNDDDIAETVMGLTGGRGCDKVIIAAATDSSQPLELAAEVARDRARVVMVGLTGTTFPYPEFMKKELNLVVSRSYGPGRYDGDFENRGVKYPEGWVRWTETENLAEVMRLLDPAAQRRLNVAALTTHRMDLDKVEDAYAMILEASEPHLGVVLSYPDGRAAPETAPAALKTPAGKASTGRTGKASGKCRLGVIGAGGFARAVLLPELKRIKGVQLHTLVTRSGSSAEHGQETFGFAHAATDPAAVFQNPEVDAVLVATRHDTHADLTARALEVGKPVLVEKPLGLSDEELNHVVRAREGSDAFFQVGFNRRYAPQSVAVRKALAAAEGAKTVLLRVNAGAIPADHWVHAADEGGGRILGEVCHFIDLARFLVGSPIVTVHAQAAQTAAGTADDVTVGLNFADGSLATVFYTAQGDGAAGKERIEAYGGGALHVIEDFRRYTLSRDGKTRESSASQDKGFAGSLAAFVAAVKAGGPAPVDEAELLETSRATVAVLESLRTGRAVEIG